MLILRQKPFLFCTPRLKTPQPVLPYVMITTTHCIAYLISKYKPETEIGLLTSCIVGGGSKDLGGVFGVGGRSLRGNGHVVSTVKKIF